MEAQRLLDHAADYRAIRRGWCFGDDQFRRELIQQTSFRATENHQAPARQETAEEKARHLLAAELERLGWSQAELAERAKGDAAKIQIARRLRTETTVTLKWIATELHMGTGGNVSNLLRGQSSLLNA